MKNLKIYFTITTWYSEEKYKCKYNFKESEEKTIDDYLTKIGFCDEYIIKNIHIK